jgi:hypothetical protein
MKTPGNETASSLEVEDSSLMISERNNSGEGRHAPTPLVSWERRRKEVEGRTGGRHGLL